MSWDVILEKPLPGTNVDLFDESSLEAFDLTAVQNCLRVICPHITETRPLWMLYEERSFEMEFDLAEDFIMLHVHILEPTGEQQFLILLGEICKKLQCRAFDTGGDYLF